MSEENFAKNILSYLEKANLFDWFILFGFTVVIISIRDNSIYTPLGGYFFAFGTLGHFVSVLLNQKGNVNIWVKFGIKVVILFSLCLFILKKYPEFNPFN